LARARPWVTVVLCLAATLVHADSGSGRRLALGGQCALGWVYGHRILTDCSITWVDTRNGDTYCFTTRTARERFVKSASENIDLAHRHFRSAPQSTGGD
jgi:hypothetical protein